MKKGVLVMLGLLVVFSLVYVFTSESSVLDQNNSSIDGKAVDLPVVEKESGVGELIYNRRSHRNFEDKPLSREDIACLLWSGEGITVDGVTGPTRSSPSAGATDPLKLYLLVSEVEDLKEGIYYYDPLGHNLTLKIEGKWGQSLADSALGQTVLQEAPVVLIVAADFERTTSTYRQRGERYVHIEAGHAAQNINLMAEEKGLGTVIIGAFTDDEVKDIINSEEVEPLLLIPAGYPEE